ncbi:MAG: hypothetical protein NXI31_15410 [bacterium]|nr:hypothetical protein [bacterium]
MSLKVWALKTGELKPLSRPGLLLFTARCAMRVEPWAPPGCRSLWDRGLARIVEAACGNPIDQLSLEPLAAAISNSGARAYYDRESTDEALGRCHNHATQTLQRGVEAVASDELKLLKKMVLDAAKFSASIPAVLAHDGRVSAPDGEDPVDFACIPMWRVIKADVAAVAEHTSQVVSANDPIEALRECADPWLGSRPAWTAIAAR